MAIDIKKVPPKTWIAVVILGGGIGFYLRRRKAATSVSVVPGPEDVSTADGAYVAGGQPQDYGRSPTSLPYGGVSPTDPDGLTGAQRTLLGVISTVEDEAYRTVTDRIRSGAGTTTPVPVTPVPVVTPNVPEAPAAGQAPVEATRVAAGGGNPYATGYRPRFAPA